MASNPVGRENLLKWWRTRVSREWPASVPTDRCHRCRGRTRGRIAATFIGHSTFLIQTGRSSILTDPVFTSHAGPFGRFGPRRVRPRHTSSPTCRRSMSSWSVTTTTTTAAPIAPRARCAVRAGVRHDAWKCELPAPHRPATRDRARLVVARAQRGRGDRLHTGPALLGPRPARPQSNVVGRLRRQSRREDDLLHG